MVNLNVKSGELWNPPDFYYILRPFTVFFTRKWEQPPGFDKKGTCFIVCLSRQEAVAICRQSLSAIMAINSLLVGLPLVLWMV